MEKYRNFLKAHWWYERDKVETDKIKKIPPPPLQKLYSANNNLIDLVAPENLRIKKEQYSKQ